MSRHSDLQLSKYNFTLLAVGHILGHFVIFANTLPEPAPPSELSPVELTEPSPAPVVEEGKI